MNGSFLNEISRPDRLRDIADRFNLDQSAVLDNVLYARAYTSKFACIVYQELHELQKNSNKFRYLHVYE